MKKKEKKNTEKNVKWRKIALISVIIGALLAILMAILLPILKINRDFDVLVDKMTENGEAVISITDMSAENVHGNEKGETLLASKDILIRLSEISDDMRYKGKTDDALGAWDIRIRVNGKELYVAKDKMYYVFGGVHYNFVPKNDEALKEYEEFYKEIEKLLE